MSSPLVDENCLERIFWYEKKGHFQVQCHGLMSQEVDKGFWYWKGDDAESFEAMRWTVEVKEVRLEASWSVSVLIKS